VEFLTLIFNIKKNNNSGNLPNSKGGDNVGKINGLIKAT